MNFEQFRDYCLRKKGVEECCPFGPETLVFKVMGKMFALTGLDEPECSANLKCDPERSAELRASYPDDILPGYHMSKLHWNTVRCEGGLDETFLRQLIDHSYDLVLAGLPKKLRQAHAEL